MNNDLLTNDACNIGVKGKSCLSTEFLEAVENSNTAKHDEKIMSKIQKFKKTGSRSIEELDLLFNKDLMNELGMKEIENQMKNFKPMGSTSESLLSNFHHMAILGSISRADPTFYPIPVQLMDFMEPNYTFDNSMKKFEDNIEEISEKYNSACCVLNTLKSTGNLSSVGHWVCLYMDFNYEPYTIEYYNSSGASAPPELNNWMKALSEKIPKKCMHMDVSNIRSQKGPTECGVYVIYYIVCRLCGIDMKEFRKKEVPDHIVTAFREYIMINEEPEKVQLSHIANSAW